MSGAKLPPVRDLARWVGRAVQTTTTAARIVAKVGDQLSGGTDAIDARQLHEAVLQLELESQTIEAQLRAMLQDEEQDDVRVETIAQAVDRLNDRVSEVDDKREQFVQRMQIEVAEFTNQVRAFDDRLREIERRTAFLLDDDDDDRGADRGMVRVSPPADLDSSCEAPERS